MMFSNYNYDPSKSHHRKDGFVNRYLPREQKKGIFKWQWQRFKVCLPKPPAQHIASIEPDLQLIHQQHKAVTWLGHSTILLQLDGLNILTDPHWSKRASPFSFIGPKRHQQVAIAIEELPKIDLVLISHNHWDHLDKATIQRLLQQFPKIQFFVPLGVERWLIRHIKGTTTQGALRNVIAMDWDDCHTIVTLQHEIQLHFLAVQHWSARYLWDRYHTLWGSYAVMHPQFRFWFSGDLGYSQDCVDIAAKLGGFDLAAISIGAYAPRYLMQQSHLNPQEAVQVMKDVKADKAFGIHWGTFENLSDESLDEPPKLLQQILQQEKTSLDFRILKHGQTWVMP